MERTTESLALVLTVFDSPHREQISALTPELVPANDACPTCGERRMDYLIWIENDWPTGPAECVECQTCGQTYVPGYDECADANANTAEA